MSSMRNAVQRRNHKERAQPLERQKWGVLEKHKDYSLRAKDYNEKKKRLKILREKAAERNPDEFHFGMLSSKTDNHGRKLADRGNKALSVDAVKLLKTQDAGYLRTMAQRTRRAREKLEQEFVLRRGDLDKETVQTLGERTNMGQRQHIVFVESKAQQKIYDPNGHAFAGNSRINRENAERTESDYSDSEKDEAHILDLVTEQPERSRKSIEEQTQTLKAERTTRKQRKRNHETRRSKLEALKQREENLVAAEMELEIQRGKMSNSIGGITRTGLKWMVRERKR